MRRWWREPMKGYFVVRPHTNRLDCWCRWVVGSDCTPYEGVSTNSREEIGLQDPVTGLTPTQSGTPE